MLRDPNPKKMMFLLFDILRIFVITEQKEYQRNLTLHILCLISGRQDKTSFWQFYKSGQAALNEDLCERELSSLARAVSNDTTGGRLEFCNKQFKLGSFTKNILDKWEVERVTDDRSARWNQPSEKLDGPDLSLVSVFLQAKVRELSSPLQFFSYTGNPITWRSGGAARKGQKHVPPKAMLINTSRYLPTLLFDCKRLVSTPLVNNFTAWSEGIDDVEEIGMVLAEEISDISDDEAMGEALAPSEVVAEVLVDESVEGDLALADIITERKRTYVPTYQRSPAVELSEVLPLVDTLEQSNFLHLSAKRTEKRTRVVVEKKKKAQKSTRAKAAKKRTSEAKTKKNPVPRTNQPLTQSIPSTFPESCQPPRKRNKVRRVGRQTTPDPIVQPCGIDHEGECRQSCFH